MNSHALEQLLSRFAGLTLGVIGDFCLDAYWLLDDEDLDHSRETGKRILAVRSQRYSLGGAGNVAHNAKALGVGSVHAFGVIGPDLFGGRLRQLLEAAGVETSGLICQERDWDTCAYAKPYSGGQERDRLDFGRFNILSRASEDALLRKLEESLPRLHGLVINQQLPRGIHSDSLIPRLQSLVRGAAGKVILIDARDVFDRYSQVIFKLNAAEATRMCGPGPVARPDAQVGGTSLQTGPNADAGVMSPRNRPHPQAGGTSPGIGPDPRAGGVSRGHGQRSEHDPEVPDPELAALARRIHSRSGREVIITRGDRGMLAFDGEDLCEVPGIPHHGPIDPVGAGDTAAAAITASLAAGATLSQAIEVGNYAAGVVVRKLRQTGTATPEEILAMASGHSGASQLLDPLARKNG